MEKLVVFNLFAFGLLLLIACQETDLAAKHQTSLKLEEQMELLARETGVNLESFQDNRSGEPLSPDEFEEMRAYLL